MIIDTNNTLKLGQMIKLKYGNILKNLKQIFKIKFDPRRIRKTKQTNNIRRNW